MTAGPMVQENRVGVVAYDYKRTLTKDLKRPNARMCLEWIPMQERGPRVQLDADGNPFVWVKLKAQVTKKCDLKFSPAENIRLLDTEDSVKTFEVKVPLPAFTLQVQGPGFRDRLIIEAPFTQFKNTGFFQVFQDSRVSLSVRMTDLSTTNDSGPLSSAKVVPVVGGFFSLPVPLIKNLYGGFMLYQNLSNLTPPQNSAINYNEFGFDVRYFVRGSKRSGFVELAPTVEFRVRNIYEITDSEARSFVIGSGSLFGVGADFSWTPGAMWASPKSVASRIILDFGYRCGIPLTLGEETLSGYSIASSLSYQFLEKWALGFAFSKISLKAVNSVDESITNEGVQSFGLRLELMPSYRAFSL